MSSEDGTTYLGPTKWAVSLLEKLQLVVVGVKHFVARVALGDGNRVGHQVPEKLREEKKINCA